MSTSRLALVLGPGVGAGVGMYAIVSAVALILVPGQVVHVTEAAVSWFLLGVASVLLGISAAGAVDEARHRGPQLAVWLGVATSAAFVVCAFGVAAIASLCAILPLVAIRLLVVLGLASGLGAAIALLLVRRLVADSRAGASPQSSVSRVNAGVKSIEDLLSGAALPGEVERRLRRLVERHRRSIEAMSHVATEEDVSLEEALSKVDSCLRESVASDEAGAGLETALRHAETMQERRIAAQVRQA